MPRLRLEHLEAREVPAANFYALGSGAGAAPTASLIDSDTGVVRFIVTPFGSDFAGGVHVAVGDVTGDTVPDLIASPGGGGGGIVKVFDGVTGAESHSFAVFDPNFRGGAYVAAGDVNLDGIADVVVGAGAGGGSQITVIDGKTGGTLANFFAFGEDFRGGVRVATGDVDGDGRADVVASAGPGGGPHVKAFGIVAGKEPTVLFSAFAYGSDFTGGVYVAVGDVNNDGFADVITGADQGGGPHVKVFSGASGELLGSFFADAASSRNGVRVGMRYDGTNADGIICTASGNTGKEFSGPLFTESPVSGSGDPLRVGASVVGLNTAQTWANITTTSLWSQATAPTRAARVLGMVGGAMFDAVNSITGDYQAYRSSISAAAGSSLEAAAAQAAHDVLVSLFPSLQAGFDKALEGSLALITDADAKAGGIAVGAAVAADMIAWRATDGSSDVVAYTPGSAPGDYQLTPPGFGSVLDPNWPYVTPFAMTAGDQFRPIAPPALDSAEYAADFNEVKDIGGTVSSIRTADQVEIGHFWADVPGNSPSPPGHWFEIANRLTQRENLSLSESVRTFALVGIAVADAGIVSWDAKYFYDFWRPVTAIQVADTDGNPDTDADPTWTPLWVSPPFPTYTSGHSTFSGAAATVLEEVFGSNYAFHTGTDDMPGVVRSFASLQEASSEAGKSRVYGGIHFEFDNAAGLSSGRELGQYIVGNFLVPI